MRIWLALAVIFAAVQAQANCRLALALALDVSGSVDEKEYVLQMNGVATALADPDVQNALFAMPDVPVALAIYEWSSSAYQRMILEWTMLNGPADLEAIRTTLLEWRRNPAPEATGLGASMLYGRDLLARSPECWQNTLDISADGKNNDWPVPERLRREGRLGTMTVNALVIGEDFLSTLDQTPDGIAELSAYFTARIIYGPNAFVEIATGYEDYATAMTRKLLRELATLPLGSLDEPASESRNVRLARQSRASD
ncbi:MAG: DUF1194 domain-containing protein [Boseongicola sp.]|nr:DUF1194 domain-containing protein [Boseongicola sp.]